VTELRDLRGELTTRSVVSEETLSVALVGCLDMDTTPSFAEFMLDLTPRALVGAFREIRFDTAELYLMSSSAISCFANFLKSVKRMEQPCRITFRTSEVHRWQRRAFEPLQRLAQNVVNIE